MSKKTPWYKKDVGAFLPPRTVDVVTTTQNLSVMLDAGLTVPEALDVLQEQSSGSIKKTIKRIHKRIQSGDAFGDALETESKVFSPIFVSAVKIGETSGTLAENLKQVATQMQHDLRVRQNIQSAMFYPIIVLVATIGLGFAIATFVLPQMIDVFVSLNVELPWTTRFLIFLAHLFGNYGLFIAPATIVGVILVVMFLKQKFMQRFTHPLILALPGVGTFSKDVNRARFCRSLGTLLKSGVPIQESLQIAADSFPNVVYKNSVNKMHEMIASGENFSTIIGNYPDLYPKMIHRMVAVGEQSGGMQSSLLYLAVFYERKVEYTAKNFSAIIEPVLLVFIGLAVAFVALSIISPIYSVTESLTL